MQALQAHLGADEDEEEGEEKGERDSEGDGDRQMRQLGFCDGGFVKVHFEQVQVAIDLGGKRGRAFLGFRVWRERRCLSFVQQFHILNHFLILPVMVHNFEDLLE